MRGGDKSHALLIRPWMQLPGLIMFHDKHVLFILSESFLANHGDFQILFFCCRKFSHLPIIDVSLEMRNNNAKVCNYRPYFAMQKNAGKQRGEIYSHYDCRQVHYQSYFTSLSSSFIFPPPRGSNFANVMNVAYILLLGAFSYSFFPA